MLLFRKQKQKCIYQKKIDNAPVVDKNNKPIGLIDEKDLLKRLKKRDVKRKDDRWVEFYKNNRKDLYNPIQDNEADHVLYYNQNNLAEIIKQLKKIIK